MLMLIVCLCLDIRFLPIFKPSDVFSFDFGVVIRLNTK